MPIKSDNTQGNPYHDESTGEFTSANGGGAKQEKIGGSFEGQQQNVDPTTNISNVQQTEEAKPRKFKLKLKTNVEDSKNQLRNYNKVASIPFLTSARDIEEHLEEFFTPEIVNNIDSKFGKFNIPYKYFNLRTDPNQRCGVNIFAACIGKKRWTNNYLKLIDYNEYSKLSHSYGFKNLYRGLNCNDREFKIISESYSSKENEMIYGSVGGTAYGIAVYASSSRWEAEAYANRFESHVMDLVLNERARTMNYNQICRIRNECYNNRQVFKNKVEKIFIDNGIEPSRARQMAISFGDYTLNDEGFVAMLCGVEWYQSGSYHMIENLGSLYRLLK